MKLSMLQRSRLNPELSAYEQVDGIHIFEPHKQLTYAPHSVDGWYPGPSVRHYICCTCYNIDTGGETTPYKIAFFPEFMKMPNYNSRDMAIRSDVDLAKNLQTPRPESPFQVGEAQLNVIRESAKTFDAETIRLA